MINTSTPQLLCKMLLLLLVLVIAIGCNENQATEDTKDLNVLAQQIDRKLMCPVCPSETVDQSQTQIAKQMKGIIREKLNQGENTEDILSYFVDRYGVEILAEPPKSGFNLLIWIVPPMGLLLGSMILIITILSMRKRTSEDFNLKTSADLDKYLLEVDGFIEKSINRPQITDQLKNEKAND